LLSLFTVLIPPLLEGPSRRRRERHHLTEEQAANKRFQNVIGMLHSQISQHRNGNIFHNPIKDSEAPDYRDIVKRPMDLKTIKTRIKDGLISTSLEFQRDVFLMFANSMMYNKPDSDIYAMAEAVFFFFEFRQRIIADFLFVDDVGK
jgi:bromodomain-containing protein 8